MKSISLGAGDGTRVAFFTDDKPKALGEIVELIEKPDDPPSNLVMIGFCTFTPAIFHACHLVQPSDCGEYELPDAVDLFIQSGRTNDTIRMDGWRIDVDYPGDRDEAERRLQDTGADDD